MKKVKYSSLGNEIELSVPSDVAEFDTNAKRVGACLDEATNNVVYRGMLANYRYYFLHGISQVDIDEDKESKIFVKGTKPVKGVEELTGIDRKTVPVLDKEGKPKTKDGQPVETFDPNDSEARYFARVCAEKNVKPESFASTAKAVADALVFDASETAREPKGPAKLAQKYKDIALSFITGKKKLENIQAKFKSDLGGKQYVPITERVDAEGKKVKVAADDAENVEALGRLCKEWADAQDAFAKVG